MAKNAFLGIRLGAQLKRDLEEIARIEQRTVSQVCELLLRGGIDNYRKKGSQLLPPAPRSKSQKKS